MFPFQVSLNASTLFPFKLDLAQQIEVAADAGYAGLEIWMRDVEAWQAAGKPLAALRTLAEARGLVLANAIAFFSWADSDPHARAAAFAQAEREMSMLAELGCRAVAAPPFGNVEATSLSDMAAAFAHLAELGQRSGVEPYLEFWGRAKKLSRLSEALFVAVESGVPDAKLLL
ncbi:MAG TPA: TIM barrel protein, partial [Roseiflexaceae bacterium]|nr:TIM barrel protein [Roseiflexaceae bacterium]